MQLRKKSVFTSALALSLALIAIFYMGVIPVSATTMAELRGQQSALENKKNENDRLIKELENDTKRKTEYSAAVTSQIEIVEAQADMIVARIQELDKAEQIFQAEKPLIEKDIQELYLKLKGRASSINMGADIDALKELIGPDTFINYTLDTGVKLSVYEETLVNKLSDKMEYLRKQEKAIAANKNELKRIKTELESKSEELTALYSKNQELLISATKTEAEIKAEAERINAEKAKTEKAIDDWYSEYREKQIEVNGDSAVNLGGEGFASLGTLLWPMPGYTDITCYFGEDDHRGIDVAGNDIYGKSIVAAADGVIAFAGDMGTYGNVVFVDHGNGMQTRYAHMSAVAVTEGQSVTEGQVIGYAGSTGNSTGPHLHFEVIYEDELVNPFLFY